MITDHSSEELTAWLRLAAEPGLGRGSARTLLVELGLPQNIFTSSAAVLGRYLPRDIALRLASTPEPEVRAAIDAARQQLSLPGHCLLTLADPQFPSHLLDIADPPLLLFVRGDPQLLQRPAVAIVGARSATEGGKDNARAFARYLAGRGWAIVSGLARGVDAAAHEGALDAGPQGGGTVAVLAGGLDLIYPRQHVDLAERVAASGAIVTEYLPGTPPIPYRFPERNRLVAGLSQGVLVVEAAAQSGSLLTARMGLECGREVFAIPGSIHAPLSRGCHALIRQGAKLVEQGRDIEEELQRSGRAPKASRPLADTMARAEQPPYSGGTASASRRSSARMLKDPLVNRVLSALGYDPASVDLLCQRSGLEFSRIAAALTELELNDIVQRLEDGRYQRRQHSIIDG